MSSIVTTPDHEVAIIGAGFSGLGVASALRQKGIEDFVLLERAADIGGTWRDNTYPGIAVDIPSLSYQFSYDLNPGWSQFFAPGAEVKAYADSYADRNGLRGKVRLESDVTKREWDEEACLWRLEVNGDRELTARFVISAIGAFVDPKPSGIDGLEDFNGKLIHSARWDHDYDLTGKRVAIVGTGASAVQIIPSIAPEVARLDVYQRTPIWVSPKFNPPIPGVVKRLFARVPFVQRLAHRIANEVVDFFLVTVVIHYRRAPFLVRLVEAHNKRFIASQVRDPELRRKLTPDYSFGCKRPSVSNKYLRTFNRENVDLVTDPIARVTAAGIETADGREREVDVLILATGFRLASDPENYRRSPVRGTNGFDLATHYERNRLKAYESISMPGLPNHFIIFGPYGFTGGSWFTLVEITSRHIVRVISECRRRGATRVEITPEATDRFHAMVERRMPDSLWFNADCTRSNSYYYDHHGDAPYLRPTSSAAARKASKGFPLSDYAYAA